MCQKGEKMKQIPLTVTWKIRKTPPAGKTPQNL